MLRSFVISALLPVGLVLAWELSSRYGYINDEVFSQPTAIVTAGLEAAMNGTLFFSTLQTLQAASLGLALGTLVGLSLGIFLGLQRFFEISSRPMVEMLRSIPAIAFTPLALLVFGFGLSMEGAIISYSCCWPVMVATLAATRNIEPRFLEVAATLEMHPMRQLRSIIVPAVLSRVAVGFRTAIGFALVVAVTVEILVNPRGLGYALIVAQQSFRPDQMYAYLVWLAMLGMAVGELSKLIDLAATRNAT
jgi:NitT/TauT family transport system permease protein